jgi:hypothetical protein
VGITANQPQTDPDRDLARRLVRGVYTLAMAFSAFMAAGGILLTGQILNDEIPAGRIKSITGGTKMGPRLLLDTGDEVVFSNQALYEQPKTVELSIGDQVEKRRDSVVYVVNGKPLTDVPWVLRNCLLPAHLLITLGVCLSAGTIFVLAFRRTPIGDSIWSDDDPKRPRRPRTRVGMIAAMVGAWFVACGLATTAFGCMVGCPRVISRAFSG